MSEIAADWLGRIQPYFSEYGCWFVLAALFLENVVLLGAIMPGVVVLVIAGGLAQQAGSSPYSLALAGFVGTVAGDACSYLIGKKAGVRLARSERWGKGFAAVGERVRTEPALFAFCHFFSYLRLLVPATAGAIGVPFGRWVLLDATGAALWVSSHVAVGYCLSLSGASAAGRTIALAAVAVFVVIVGAHHLKTPFRTGRRREES
jgi:membrane protein DedA with SNARE-associated domain